MKVFTYMQYIKVIHTLKLNSVLQLAEESSNYNLDKPKNKHLHDKLIKNILKEKKEAEQFINQYLKPKQKIKSEELILYTNSYITKKYKSKEADLVYKIKNKEIFFLIEHQSTIDNNVTYRILSYCIDIMQEWSRSKKIGKNTYYPIIVPIVIYTGNKKWEMPKNVKEKQIDYSEFEKYKINLEINIIDINKINKRDLLEKGTMFSYIMILEKSENKNELMQNLEILIENIVDKEKSEKLANIINYLLNDILKNDEQEEMLEKIDRKVGENDMSNIYNVLLKEFRKTLKQGERQGKKQGKKIGREEGKKEVKIEIVKNMLQKKIDEQIILDATEINKDELEKIKNDLNTKN